MKSKWLAIPVLILGLLAAGDWLLWTALASRLRDEYAAWTRSAWAHGWVATADHQTLGGFPFTATLTLDGFQLRGGVSAVPGGLTWDSDRLTLELGLSHPSQLFVRPEGHEQLRLSGVQPIVFTADHILASVPLGRVSAGQKQRLDLEAESIAGGVAHSDHPTDVRIERLSFRLAAQREISGRTDAALGLDVRDIQLPDTGRWPLGATIPSLRAELGLSSPRLPPDTAAAAAAWRTGGGRLDLRSLDLRWGPLDVSGHAALGLDERLQPEGKGVAQLVGADAALDALSNGGAIPAGLGATAKAVLALMARPAPDGHGVVLPVAVKHGTVSVGKIPIVKMREIDWDRV